ncbi:MULTISPECIES: hypothetical protein [Vagococcus]|uniref:Uncharacterized protein n=1 Tax=Vagococcus fluvialis bH819 TaxID=1255619 RepID=A0A1X6WNL2_9ENTE|nr:MULTISPECIES: hypothetical protein [Vagococcus]SLM85859.1 hypothetical protein FM121_07140 [Vagococcus fluvialis bH819]
MKYSKEFSKKIVLISVGMMITGFVVTALGFSMSGANYKKYQTDDKKWYQVISILKN